MLCEPDDIVVIRHSFLGGRQWRVLKSLPSLQAGVMLYRIQLLNKDGSERLSIQPITIVESIIKKKTGRFQP